MSALLGISTGVTSLSWSAPQATVDFRRDIEPIFRERCYACHGPQQQMGGLRLDEQENALRGGNAGPVILPGKSGMSGLIERITSDKQGFRMPAAGSPLSAEQISRLRTWIDEGATWPDASPTSTKVSNSAEVRAQLWSVRPIRRVDPPTIKNVGWARNQIDYFVLSRLEAEGIRPSGEASRPSLLRRLSLDLIGLPPTTQEINDFLMDNRDDAYERAVDRLLASPHYGEKWARQWLDLAHYADSDGYEKDLVRPYAWRYRDWVINAINEDMPFNEFTTEQLAGDLLPNATVEQKVATGFLRNTLTNREAGVSREEIRFEQLVDRTSTVGTTWLGLTVGCAQCHDHKYDPTKQRDFYQLLTYFHKADEKDIDAPLAGEIGPYLLSLRDYNSLREELLRQYRIPELQTVWENDMREAMTHPGKHLDWDFEVSMMKALLDGAEQMLNTVPDQRTARQKQLLTAYFLRRPSPAINKDPALLQKIKEAREKFTALESSFPALTQAMTMAENPSAGKSYLRIRGDYKQLGIEVEARTPEFLPPLPAGAPPNRLSLARWLVSRENPLTARVAVNRMWQELFGRGLVTTSEDFGAQGDKPSHAELLDWLASEFMDNGWSVKHMHKLIVLSATYRQTSTVRKDLLERDPENRMLARQARVRLPAELIRDNALAAAGLLDPSIGGPSVRPPQPPGVAELAYDNSVKWVASKGKDRYRRGLYIHFQRSVPYPQLVNFDGPDSLTACSRRQVSNTPLQALNLLNDEVFFEAAQALAFRILQEADSTFDRRLELAFTLSLGRKPTPSEAKSLERYLQDQTKILQQNSITADSLTPSAPEGVGRIEAAAWTLLSRVLLNLDEFITRN